MESRELNWELLDVTRKPVNNKKSWEGNKQDRKTSTSSGLTTKGTMNNFSKEVNRTLGVILGKLFLLVDPHFTHKMWEISCK